MNIASNSYSGKTLVVLLVLCAALSLSAGTARYVNVNSTNPVPPFTDWSTAATNIQDAVDAAVAGDEVVVTNGVYQTGARAIYAMSNRVAVTIPVTVRSVNGPEVTTIVGYQVPGVGVGQAAVRCVYLTNEAVLAGFTLTNGATQIPGDPRRNGSGGGVWSESVSAIVSNCVLTGNSAFAYGGGTFSGTLNDCTIAGNSAASYYGSGGGTYRSTLNNCTVKGNSAYDGGGTYRSTLNNCVLIGNSASEFGGGAYFGTLNNCEIVGNAADDSDGGAANATLNNCVLTGNSAYEFGGGAADGTLTNCTLAGNSAATGGGMTGGTLNNCIVYHNSASNSPNYYLSTIKNTCTTPLPPGTGNLADDPQLASASHLSANSPCRNRGGAAYVSGVDIDGEPWANLPSIGCDEYWSGSVTGAISVAVVAAYTSVAAGFAVDFKSVIDGRVSASRWDFGDGNVVSNQPYATHAWTEPGGHVVELRAYNESYQTGVAATAVVRVLASPIHYVALDGRNPVPPYTTWTTAATNIQDAVDAAVPGALVRVSNGVYQAGARQVKGMSNRLAVTIPVTVRSVNGSAVTTIAGAGPNGLTAVRCVYLTNGAALVGFTLTNGATQASGNYRTNQSGAGVWCEGSSAKVSDCVLTGNSAYYFGGGSFGGTLINCALTGNLASYGGGASGGELDNCMVTGNLAASEGGGTYGCVMKNSTVSGNSAYSGGGVMLPTLSNCIIYYNRATYDYANHGGGILNNCCTTPLPAGTGNLTNAPSFVNTNGWSNLRLQSNSLCINAGNNAYATTPVDFDGNERISGGTVDMGAYEWTAVPTHYVSINSSNPVAPYRSWSTAATNIQDGVDTAVAGDEILVTNGVFATGGRAVGTSLLVNRVAVDKPLMVRSVNGPEVTIIRGFQLPGTTNGDGAIRCVYLTSNAILSGFTLTNGATLTTGDWYGDRSGGGVRCDTASAAVSYCVLTGNSASYEGGGACFGTLNNCTLKDNSALVDGGGAYAGTLNHCTLTRNSAWNGGGSYFCMLSNCILTGNSASLYGGGTYASLLNNCRLTSNLATGQNGSGGGAYYGTLNNCTLTGNSAAYEGGGAYSCELKSCIVYFNRAPTAPNFYQDKWTGPINYSCTVPMPTNAIGNIANLPVFVDTNDWSNLRLQPNSPCINAGNNGYSIGTTDLDGNPRIVGGTVDIGAYEFQSPASQLSFAWLQQYGLPTDGSADFTDPDGDRANNWQEWQCATVPTNALSALRLLTVQAVGTDLVVTWESVSNKTYFLERSTVLGTNATFLPLATGIAGQAGTTTFIVDNAAGAGLRFYRVGAQ